MTWLLEGGRVIDPKTGTDDVLDVLLGDGVVRAIGPNLSGGQRRLDCRGKYVVPGLIDMGARVGEPGYEHRETISSATRAAVVGGFTGLAALPEADPVPDVPQAMGFVLDEARRDGIARVYPVAALTKGAEGRELSEMGALREAGAIAVASMDAITDGGVLRRALAYAGMFPLPVLLRGVDEGLADGGVMHEGMASTIRGLPGLPRAAEDAAVARHLIVAELTGVPIHLLALSSGGAVDLLRRAKARGVAVTASVSAQQLVFTDEDVRSDDPLWKTEPPFRSKEDVTALRQGVADGTIDVVFSDHAPWAREEKDVEFDRAPFGMIGLESALPLLLTELVAPGHLSLGRVVELMSTAPARILGVPGGTLQPGEVGDVTVIDPDVPWVFDVALSESLSRNTPVDGRRMIGRAAATFVGGRLVMRDGKVIEG